MKKTIAAAVMVFALALLALIAIYFYVNPQQDQVAIEETVLFGDTKAAEGLTFTTTACDSCSRKLLWKTEYVVSEQPKTTTQFQRVKDDVYSPDADLDYIELEEDCFISSSDILSDEIVRTLPEDHPVISDVASRTTNGKTREETHRLREYYQYYPVKLSMDISGINIDKASLHTDYFKIPVPADYSIKVTVKKDEKGKIIRYEMAPVHSYFEPEIEGLFTTNGCFVALPDLKYEADHKSTTEEDDDSWLYMKDLRLSQAMRGIHFVPFVAEENKGNKLRADFDNAKLIVPLPSTSQVLRMQQSQDQKKIIVLLRERGELVLSVIDAASKKVLQRTPLQQISAQRNMNMIKEKDGRLLIVADDGQIHLLTQVRNQYRIEISGSLEQVVKRGEFSSLPSYWSFDYDGENLALATFSEPFDGRYPNCSVYVFLYGQSKLKYAGYYKNSLNKENAGSESGFVVAPVITHNKKGHTIYSSVDGIDVKLN
ncbi:hypothetical protein [Emergencia timonensis]|uniref:hypothetical protein n=1 Tax=Emergencia timonensis TaxID=1776384 RepID=UPI003996BB81